MKEGLLQPAEYERVGIFKLNLGPRQTILVSGSSVTVYASLHHFESSNRGQKNVSYINGGEEGDILFLTGWRVKLNSNGNIAKSATLKEDEVLRLIFINGEWV